jgi:TPR repeat protein
MKVAADNGNDEARIYIGKHIFEGNRRAPFESYLAAKEILGTVARPSNLNEYDSGELVAGLNLLRQSAAGNYFLGHLAYGVALLHGIGCAPDVEGSIQEFEAAVHHINYQPCNILCFKRPPDPRLPTCLYLLAEALLRSGRFSDGALKMEEAANLGYLKAIQMFGICLWLGIGVEKDVATAVSFVHDLKIENPVVYFCDNAPDYEDVRRAIWRDYSPPCCSCLLL